MTSAATTDVNVSQRCAVCKIDLKGRFAFIDEEFLALTGYSYEELLGKPASGILEPASRDLINRLISGRSHYEAVYDSAPLTLISKNKQSLGVTAIMFLNFSGGNPVNFQLILSTHAISQRVKAASVDDNLLTEFIRKLAAIDTTNDWQGILNALLKLSSAGQAGWYGFDSRHLVPMATVTDESDAAFAGKELTAATDWHLKIAESGEEYNFTDGKSVQKAVESNDSAPNEFITTFRVHNDKYVLRLIYGSDVASIESVNGINRTKTVIPLICKLVNAIQ